MDCIHDGSFKRKDVLIDKISADKEEMTTHQKDQKNDSGYPYLNNKQLKHTYQRIISW